MVELREAWAGRFLMVKIPLLDVHEGDVEKGQHVRFWGYDMLIQTYPYRPYPFWDAWVGKPIGIRAIKWE
jgi:hypothetical protein